MTDFQCGGCGEFDGLHRDGCSTVPEPSRCTCYDPASLEYAPTPCAVCTTRTERKTA